MKNTTRISAIFLVLLMMLSACSQSGNQSSNTAASNIVASNTPGSNTTNANTSGSNSTDADTQTGSGAKKGIMIIKQQGSFHNSSMGDGTMDQALEYDWEWEVGVPITHENNDEQIQLIEQAIANRVDGVLIMPAIVEGIIPGIEKMEEAGIPFVNVNDEIPDLFSYNMAIGFVGASHYENGYMQAKESIRIMEDVFGIRNGRVIIIEGTVGAESNTLRVQAYHEVITESGWELVDQQPGNYNREMAFGVVQNLLQKYDDVDLYILASGTMVLGSSQAFEQSGQDVKFSSHDIQPELMQLMCDNPNLICTIDTTPYETGKLAVKMLKDYFDGTLTEKYVVRPGTPTGRYCDNWQEYLEAYDMTFTG